MTAMNVAAVQVLADGNGPEFGKASPLGLLMILLLLIAAGLLVWSMSKHLKKIPKSFDNKEDSGEDDKGPDADDGSKP
ncbi:hypothetical protein [Jongsikchunia kroppenstedtii]|uniref:hypothetical protein n=1 Tax=Jongsikchunia kroppenstedtii TaxID=1121721 RepID=UPI000368B8CC|nr:hypothetical protein [Jongsikchunia kroppenstedtii]